MPRRDLVLRDVAGWQLRLCSAQRIKALTNESPAGLAARKTPSPMAIPCIDKVLEVVTSKRRGAAQNAVQKEKSRSTERCSVENLPGWGTEGEQAGVTLRRGLSLHSHVTI